MRGAHEGFQKRGSSGGGGEENEMFPENPWRTPACTDIFYNKARARGCKLCNNVALEKFRCTVSQLGFATMQKVPQEKTVVLCLLLEGSKANHTATCSRTLLTPLSHMKS